MQQRFGLIAGAGRFPLIFAEEAKAQGLFLVAIALKGIASDEINRLASQVHWIEIGEFQKMIDLLKTETVTEVIMAGKIPKTYLFSNISFDERLRNTLKKIENNNDDSILLALVSELNREGITVRDSTLYLKNLLIGSGVITDGDLNENELRDARFGFNIAKQIAGLDIGQTVIVKDRAVLAVEAIEGTDEAIFRGGALGNGGVVVAKVSKPNQDKRFDMPVIGINTINVMAKAGAKTLVVDAGKTIFLDKQKVISHAQASGIKIVAL